MKRTIIVLIGIFIFFTLIEDTDFNNNIKNLLEKDYYKANSYNYKIAANLNYYKTNKYYKDEFSNYIDMTDNFSPKNKQELLNVYFTILNNGWDTFSFYCDSNYKECLNDIESLSENNVEFSNINQLVNSFNAFSSITSTYDNGRIDVKINKKYSSDEIKTISDEIDKLIDGLDINNVKDVKEKIKIFHDYIVNTNTYDSVREQTGTSEYNSDSAIGTLFQGYSICSGYSDTLSIFLDKINVENYKIANESHVWNIIKLDNKWYNIDLTWDDPLTNTGESVLSHDYFMIGTSELAEKNDGKHNFDASIYNFIG